MHSVKRESLLYCAFGIPNNTDQYCCMVLRTKLLFFSVRNDSLRTVTNTRSIIRFPFESVQYLLYFFDTEQKRKHHYSRVVDFINDLIIITPSPPPLPSAVRSHTTPHPAANKQHELLVMLVNANK